jgi:hypothetical protein
MVGKSKGAYASAFLRHADNESCFFDAMKKYARRKVRPLKVKRPVV